MKSLFFFLMFMLTTNLVSQNLHKHQWKNRVLLIFSDDKNSDELKKQLDIFSKDKKGLLERKLFIYQISKNEFTKNFNNVWFSTKNKLNKYNRNSLSFKFVLIGLDGGIKYQQEKTVSLDQLFTIIDGMPMRSREIKSKITKMKFTCSVIINKPKEMVAEYFSNPFFLGEYQDGFLRKNIISGNSFEVGTVSKVYYKMGKGEMELTETVLKNELPDVFLAQYHHKHTDNTMQSSFISLNKFTTQYNAEINYTAFRGFVVKVMAFLFPSFFKKQVKKWLENFKKFVEKQ